MAPKRSAAAAAPSPAKAARHARSEGLEGVLAALGAEALMPPVVPTRVLGMLAAGAPHALAAPAEARHPMQAAVVDQIQSVFAEAATMLESRVAEAQAAADGSAEEVEAGAGKVEAIAAEILATEAAIEQQRAATAEAETALKAVEKESAAAESSLKAGAKEQRRRQKDTDDVKAVKEAGLEALVAGGFSSTKEAEKACAKLTKDMTRLGAEPSLLASASAVLLKPAEERQGFDAVVIESLRGVLTERLAAAEAALAAGVATAEALEADVAARAASAQERRRERDGHVQALARLRGDLAEQRGRRSAAEADVEALRATHSEKVGAVADAQEEVQSLKHSRETLESLATRSAAAPPAEDVAIAAA